MSVLLALTLAASATTFDPVDFFRGRTQGDGSLKVVFQQPKRIRVDSEGTVEADGTLLLSQRVQEPGKPVRIRHWRLKKTGPMRFAGTLTDAAGRVAVDLIGKRARIRYRMKNNMHVEQWLTPDGRDQVKNAMKVRRFGVIVAHLDEIIRKLD